MSLWDGFKLVVVLYLAAILSFGILFVMMPYYLTKVPLEKCVVVDDDGNAVYKVLVSTDPNEVVRFALTWLLLILVTFGLAFIVYIPAAIRFVLSRVVLKPL